MGTGTVATGLVVFNKIVNLGNRLVDAYETSKRLDVEMKKIESETRVGLAEISKEKTRIDKAYRLCREGIKSLNDNYIQTLKELSASGEEYRKSIAECRKQIGIAFELMTTTTDSKMQQLMKDCIHDFQKQIKELADSIKSNNDQVIANASQHIKELPGIKGDTKLISDK